MFTKLGVQTLFEALYQIREADESQDVLELLLGRIWFRHEQILSQRRMKDMALLCNEHYAFPAIPRAPMMKRGAPWRPLSRFWPFQGDRALGWLDLARQEP